MSNQNIGDIVIVGGGIAGSLYCIQIIYSNKT